MESKLTGIYWLITALAVSNVLVAIGGIIHYRQYLKLKKLVDNVCYQLRLKRVF